MAKPRDVEVEVEVESDDRALTRRSQAVESGSEVLMPVSVEAVKAQVQAIQDLLNSVLVEGVHYGKIPGTDKPTLLKAGAEKINVLFRLAPKYRITTNHFEDGHREIEVECELYHISTGQFVGAGTGSCSTLEAKYRWRKQARRCPACGAEAIIKGKEEYGGGWLCFKKKGGCGEKWPDDAPVITNQEVGRTENEDIADTYNTVRKMAKKRAHVDAVITCTAASDLFTQDVEDMDTGNGKAAAGKDAPKKSGPKKSQKTLFKEWNDLGGQLLGDKQWKSTGATVTAKRYKKEPDKLTATELEHSIGLMREALDEGKKVVEENKKAAEEEFDFDAPDEMGLDDEEEEFADFDEVTDEEEELPQ